MLKQEAPIESGNTKEESIAETSIDSRNAIDSSSPIDSGSTNQESKEESIDTSSSEKESTQEESIEAGNSNAIQEDSIEAKNKNDGGQEDELVVHTIYNSSSEPTETTKGDEDRRETKTNQEEGGANKQHTKSIPPSKEDTETLFQKIIKGKLRENRSKQQEEYEPQYTQEGKSKKTQKQEEEKENKTLKEKCLNAINNASNFISQLIIKEPKVYSLAYENNIACKLDEDFVVTRDGNLVGGIKVSGISYAAANEQKERELADIRNQFFNKLDTTVELNIFCKKELIEFNIDKMQIKNRYANEISNKWRKGISNDIYKISYYLLISTKHKIITGFFEGQKKKLTEEQIEEEKNNYKYKKEKLQQIIQDAENILEEFTPKKMTSDDIINFYATYCNMSPTNFKYSNELITDSYITSDIEFKKDYMIFYTNRGEEIYARFISIKSYDGDETNSIIPTSILRESSDYYMIFHCEAINKEEAIRKVKKTKAFTVEIMKPAMEYLLQELSSERQNIMKMSCSCLVISKSGIEDLNYKTNNIQKIMERQNISIARETLNQRALFFSFMPSRGNLNARLRHQTGATLSTLCTFENDILGNKTNRWGREPVSIFQHISGQPYLFNFHDSDDSSAVGHTLVIGGTGYGKTTIMQFLMLELIKYDINIFAMDKLRGMHNFTEFIGGEYHDLYDKEQMYESNDKEEKSFSLNPFSLISNEENNMFLKMWLELMSKAEEDEYEFKLAIQDTIKQIRDTQNMNKNFIPSLTDFIQVMKLPNDKDKDFKIRFKEYQKGIFDNKKDALNFDKQISILNMDAIIKNPQLSALTAMYVFHKIKNISKLNNKGFFIWIDELRDYLNDNNMRDKIIEMIVEIRKINGVITMGIQNLDFLDNIENKETFLENMSNFIIFPTKDEAVLYKLSQKINLTNSEINFLSSTNKSERTILYKQKQTGSAIINVNLEKIGKNNLRIFSSSSNDVADLIELKAKYPSDWRERYIKGLKP